MASERSRWLMFTNRFDNHKSIWAISVKYQSDAKWVEEQKCIIHFCLNSIATNLFIIRRSGTSYNPQSQSVQFFSTPARNFYVRFEKHNLTYTRCAWTGGTTEFPVPPGSNVKTSAQNLTNGEITVFHNFCDFIRIVMYELCFVSHRSHTYRKITVVSQLTWFLRES